MKQKAYIATQGTEPTLGINKPRKHLMESVVGIGADIKLVHSPLVHSPGPVPETVSDFWRMVWEENSRTIVMLTNTHERGKVGHMACWTGKMMYGCTVCSTSNTHTHTHTHTHTAQV